MIPRGVVMVAYGKRAETAANVALEALRMSNPELPVTARRDRVGAWNDVQQSRLAKLTMLDWSPYQYTAYMDADTVAVGDLSAGFDILEDGWEIVIVPSANQGDDMALWHIDAADRELTLDTLRFTPLQLQAGVMFVARTPRTIALFAAWCEQWKRFENQDQGALLRALYTIPAKVWLLGRPWNGGAVIGHRFGAVRA